MLKDFNDSKAMLEKVRTAASGFGPRGTTVLRTSGVGARLILFTGLYVKVTQCIDLHSLQRRNVS
jgi:hypothetical protein